MKAALYARVSTKDKDQDPQNQIAPMTELCVKNKWDLCQYVFIDQESGSKSDRPGLTELLKAARLHKFDIVVFWSLDRLSRQGVFPTLVLLNDLSKFGVAFYSYTEPYLDSCGLFKDAIISILATLAKQERERISERVRAGLDRARKNGKQLGRRRTVFDRMEVVRLRDENNLSWAKISAATGQSVGAVVNAYREMKG